MLTEAVKELEAELNKLTPPLAKDISNPSLIKNIAKIKKTKPKQKILISMRVWPILMMLMSPMKKMTSQSNESLIFPMNRFVIDGVAILEQWV